MAEEEKGTSAWRRVPTWDGSPATWRSFKCEMCWCTELVVGPPRETAAANVVEHEVSMVQLDRGQSLDEAFQNSRSKFAEVNSANEPSLSWDKKLVGALDSACNRTCTGTTWLNNYLQNLKNAPPEIQALVCHEPEKETFRFGNGATKASLERWRLPTMIGSTLVLFWTSVVPVSSLGLLLGRDFMDAIGAVLSSSSSRSSSSSGSSSSSCSSSSEY